MHIERSDNPRPRLCHDGLAGLFGHFKPRKPRPEGSPDIVIDPRLQLDRCRVLTTPTRQRLKCRQHAGIALGFDAIANVYRRQCSTRYRGSRQEVALLLSDGALMSTVIGAA